MYTYSKPIRGLSAIRSSSFVEALRSYETALVVSGYNPHVVRLHLHSVAHFGVWMELEGAELGEMNETMVARFEKHRSRCRCPGASQSRHKNVVSCVRVFMGHLRKRGIVPAADAPAETRILVLDFLRWMKANRGCVETTLTTYRIYVTNMVDLLGDDPRTYTASGLRDFVAKQYRHYGRNSIRMVLAAMRMFLRFLATEGRCRAGLEQALLSPPSWSQQSLPQGLSAEELQTVLLGCPATPMGLRERAVLLLLSRLGLRAGDVAVLRLKDVCFKTATIKVCGKGKREAQLPLPQDVGEALLDYLRTGRPQVESDYVFMRSVAPFQPFGARHPGSAIRYLARNALKRVNIQRPKRGSHVFRHTAACQMLRADVKLEEIAQILRHQSVETTGIYAKVDLRLLEQVAQPWPEEVSC